MTANQMYIWYNFFDIFHWQGPCQIIEPKQCVIITFSNIFNLSNMILCIASGCSVMLHSNVTSKVSLLAFNRLSSCVNMLCSHCMLWATELIPVETKSQHTYTEVYKAPHWVTILILTLPSCRLQEVHQGVDLEPACCCHAARYPVVHYLQPTAHQQASWRQLHLLSKILLESLELDLKVPVCICNTHLSAIPTNNWTCKKSFKSQEVYK